MQRTQMTCSIPVGVFEFPVEPVASLMNVKPSQVIGHFVFVIQERGKYLAFDLGGTNFRALLVKFKKGLQQNTRLYHKIYTIPLEIMQGTGEDVRRGKRGTDALGDSSTK